MGIIVNNVLIETYYCIGIVEYYHGSLQQVSSIITIEILSIKPNLALQISFKTINNCVDFNELVFILLMFGAYPKITELNISSILITQLVIAMKKTMDEI